MTPSVRTLQGSKIKSFKGSSSLCPRGSNSRGFSIWEALKNMFDVDRSAARGMMSARKLIAFRHDSHLGNAPANELFDLVTISKKEGVIPRSYADYTIVINREGLMSGVTLEEII